MSSEYETEPEQSNRFIRKMRDSPFLVFGIVGAIGIVGYGFYGLRQRKIPLSLHLIHMRVHAQGFIVGCLTGGVCYNMYTKYVYPEYIQSKEDKKPDT